MRNTYLITIVAMFFFALMLSSALAQQVSPKILKKEKTTRKKCSDEYQKLARFCEQNKAYQEARKALRVGFSLNPSQQKLKRKLIKLLGKENKTKDKFKDEYPDRLKISESKCLKLLEGLASFCDKQDDGIRFSYWAGMITMHFPRLSKEALEGLDAVYFEPYRLYVRKIDFEKLNAGGDWLEGTIKDESEVKDLNEKHSSWNAPWILTDGIHELNTTLPLRTANMLLFHIGFTRDFLLAQFFGSWDLQTPKYKMAVFVSEKYSDHNAIIAKTEKEMGFNADGGGNSEALYYWTRNNPGPLFISLETKPWSDGQSRPYFIDYVLLKLQHEITHQIVSEYLRHAAEGKMASPPFIWATEGLAEYMESWRLEKGLWHLLRIPRVPSLQGSHTKGSLAWCKANVDSLPSLKNIDTFPAEARNTKEFRRIVATLTYFLLEGQNGRYREQYLRFQEMVNKHDSTKDTFDKCFPNIDLGNLDVEWREFIREIEIDE